MRKLLKVTVSPRRSQSVSRRLADEVTLEWKTEHPDGQITERDLVGPQLPWVDSFWIDAVYNPPEATPKDGTALGLSDRLIHEIMDADDILIATPMYNFGMPAALKAWVDQVVRFGTTFTADYRGLIEGKSLNAIITSGGAYEPGAYYSQFDFCSGHLRAIMAFIGITDTRIFLAGDTHDITTGKTTLDHYISDRKVKAMQAFRR